MEEVYRGSICSKFTVDVDGSCVEACGYYPIVFGVFVFGSFDMGVPKQSSEVCSEGSVYDCKRHLGKFVIKLIFTFASISLQKV